jgi:hypothetical protein
MKMEVNKKVAYHHGWSMLEIGNAHGHRELLYETWNDKLNRGG